MHTQAHTNIVEVYPYKSKYLDVSPIKTMRRSMKNTDMLDVGLLHYVLMLVVLPGWENLG